MQSFLNALRDILVKIFIRIDRPASRECITGRRIVESGLETFKVECEETKVMGRKGEDAEVFGVYDYARD